jgi:oligopeptide transport system substrate-binding protein
MIKKIFALSMTLLAVFTLSACGKDEFTVKFHSNGGTTVADVVVEDGSVVAEPTTPTKEVTGEFHTFVGWYTDEELTTEYNFADAVTADLDLYAKWVLEVVLRFDTRTDAIISPALLGAAGGPADEPTAPTRDGYTFEGWFTTKRGLTWLEPEAVVFPYTVTEDDTLYAYWEPVNSMDIVYGEEVTYTTSIDSSSALVLNPLVYQWSHEDTYVDMMVTDLYTTEVDWDKAIAEGVASEILDFSKIADDTYSIDALDYINVKLGAVNFPIDSEGEEHLTEDGLYDRDNGTNITDTEWTYNIRQDMKFQDGTPITAEDYEYTVKMFLDPLLNNYRADMFYKKVGDRDGTPLLNGYEYYSQAEGISWEDVGFVVNSDYSFTMTFWEPVSQSEAMAYGNNIRLVEQTAFEASLTADKTNTSYGTPDYPFISYGEYILKTWDENQKLVFNKNYDYIAKGEINYKCFTVQVVDDVDQRMALFAAGDLSVAGLSLDYYNQYAEDPNVYKSWDGYPQYLLINLAPTKVETGGNEHPTIMFDVRFRQALMYGFDRKEYANSVYQPNTPSLLPIPLDTKVYLQDLLYYSQSPQHLQVLSDLNIDPATEGYIPTKAVSLFNEAYDAWVAEGNTGPVVITFISDNDEFTKILVDHIEASYEALFGTDKIDIDVVYKERSAARADYGNWDYDIMLGSIGFGSSVGAQWQYPSLSFYGGYIASYLGLNAPFDESSSEADLVAEWFRDDVEINMENTYNYLDEFGVDQMIADELGDYITLYHWLKYDVDWDQAVTDEIADYPLDWSHFVDSWLDDDTTNDLDIADYTYITVKTDKLGSYEGSMEEIAWFQWTATAPYDATASEPYAGASTDLWSVIAAFEAAYLNNVPNIPTVTRSSATIYADYVEITWPEYSVAFAWGSQRYRWLTTDSDFQ